MSYRNLKPKDLGDQLLEIPNDELLTLVHLRHDGFPFLYDAEFLFGGTEDNFSVYYNNVVQSTILAIKQKKVSL